MPLELGPAYSIIWLDEHICKKGQCQKLKTDFCMELLETALVPPVRRDPEIDDVILAIREYCSAITFVDTEDNALEAIRKNLILKKVIFITSATMGRKIIPHILEEKFEIYAYYIFCGNINVHAEWGYTYVEKGLKFNMVDFETDLLIRLARDISKDLIVEGKKLLNSGYSQSALTYLRHARTIAERAVVCDKPKDPNDPHRPSTEHRQILNGENGLSAQAEKLCNQPPQK